MPSRNGSRRRASAKGAAPRTRHSPSTPGERGSAQPATRPGSPSGRHGKFNANGEHIDGHWFASAAEGERYRQLKRLEEAGRIGGLTLQQTFELVVNNQLITRYRADFSYSVLLEGDGRIVRTVVEDVKGMTTPEFKLKHKLFNALQPVPLSILEVKGKARHPIEPTLSDKTGNPIGCVRGWMHLHWDGRIPE